MRGGDEAFKITSVFDKATARHVRVQTAVCRCGASSLVHDTGERAKPPEMMAAKFRQKGWRIGARRNADTCPKCLRGKAATKPGLTPEQKRAAWCRIAGVARAIPRSEPSTQKPKEAVMTKTPAAPSSALAAPPRAPTREDRRRILDALDDRYLVDKGCYAKGGNDQAMADHLNVPRAWVAEERERAFGPDACEADAADSTALIKLSARAVVIEREGLAVAEKAEALRRECERLTAKLAARGAA